jgi:hypothetical protein
MSAPNLFVATLGFSARAPVPKMETPAPTTPAPAPPETKKFCYGLPGAIAPVGEFDPLGFSRDIDQLEMNRLREAELTHGRVGMLAAAGFLVQEKFHPLFEADGGPAIQQIPKLPPALWLFLSLGIGASESLRIQAGWANPYDGEIAGQSAELGEPKTAFPRENTSFQRLRPGYTPGDLGFDPLGLKPTDPAEYAQAIACCARLRTRARSALARSHVSCAHASTTRAAPLSCLLADSVPCMASPTQLQSRFD